MAEKRTTPEAPGGGRRRKRPAPTIDLQASEVPAEAATPAQQASAPSAETPPEHESEPTSESPQTPGKDTTTAETAQPHRRSQGEGYPPSPERPRRGGVGAGFVGGIIGVIVAAAVAGALWYGGLIPLPSSTDNTSALREQLATLQKRVADLQNRPASAAPDTGAIDKAVAALGQRVDKMEQSIGNLPQGDKGMAERIAAADNAMKSLGIALTALNRRGDDIAAKASAAQEQAAAAEKAVKDLRDSVQSAGQQASSAVGPGQLDDVQQRIVALEKSVKSVRADLDQSTKALGVRVAKATAADKAARLALSASALQTAVASGAPYASELAQAKSLGADQQALAPLDRFAASGIPSAAALARQLLDTIPAMRKAVDADKTSGNFLDRLQANASKLVRIRPVQAPSGDAAGDILARIEVAATHADIAAALADIGKLPEAARRPAAGWVTNATARQKALAAAQRFAAETVRALGDR